MTNPYPIVITLLLSDIINLKEGKREEEDGAPFEKSQRFYFLKCLHSVI
jgi:hypothetical protein